MNDPIDRFCAAVVHNRSLDEDLLFNPPAGDEEIDQCRAALGLELPESFWALYRWHDGSRLDGDGSRIPIHDGRALLRLGDIVGIKQKWDADARSGLFDTWRPGTWWNETWVPFLYIPGRWLGCLDTAGCYAGVPGQIVGFDFVDEDDRKVLNSSFEAWLGTMTALARAGALRPGFDVPDPADRSFGEITDAIVLSLDPGYPRFVEMWRYRVSTGSFEPV